MTTETSASPARFRWFAGACVVLILMGLAHATASLGPEQTFTDPDGQTFTRLFKTYQIDLAGTKRTMFQIVTGFGWFFSMASVAAGVAGLLVLTSSPRPAAALKRLAGLYTVGALAALAISLIFWFIIPTSFIVAALVLLALSLVLDGRTRLAHSRP